MAKNMVEIKSYGAPQKQILVADELAFTIGARIGDASAVAGEDGRKIIKAGMPLAGDLLDRDTAFVINETTPNAILLHDVDVTDGETNGTIVVGGYIDLLKLDEDVQAKINTTVTDALKHIVFIKGSKM